MITMEHAYHDIAFTTSDDRVFYVHGLILKHSALSWYLVLRKTKNAKLFELHSRVAKELLQFAYIGNVSPNFDSLVVDVLVAAAKYKMDALKELCLAKIVDAWKDRSAGEWERIMKAGFLTDILDIIASNM